MNKIFYISDLHLGHANSIKFDNRPYADIEEMTNDIITKWNSVVRGNDLVYILGDMFWDNRIAPDILKQLKGHKHLILGNHDRLNSEMQKLFESVSQYKEINDCGRHVVMFHYPIAHWRNADRGTYHLYGHIHSGRDERPFSEYVEEMKKRNIPYNCYNVGCMLPWMNYTPKTLDEIIKGYDKYIKGE